MTRLFIVRHAEAEGNLYRRIHGHYNSTVTENGRRQLEALQNRFENERIDAAYSSDLHRAFLTAKAALGHRGLPIVTDSRLREVGMGVWEDKPWGEISRTDPEQAENFSRRPMDWSVPGSERYEHAARRFSDAVFEIASRHPGQTVAIFTHGSVLRTFLTTAMGLPLEEMITIRHSDNTGVTLLEMEGKAIKILYKNDNSHLTPEISTLARQKWWRQNHPEADPCLWFAPMDVDRCGDVYAAARREAWETIHGGLKGFDGDGFLREAQVLSHIYPSAVTAAMLGEQQAGILQTDFWEGEKQDAVWISLYYMMPDFRGQNLGVQLLGQAVSECRHFGRSYLRLRVSTINSAAHRFYQRYGFYQIGTEPGVAAPLLLMEKYIGF